MKHTEQTTKQTPSQIADALYNELVETNRIFGLAPSAVCRALGFYDWKNDKIVAAVSAIDPHMMTRKAITGHARMGRNGNVNYGPIPTLPRAAQRTLKQIARAAA